MIPRSNKPLEDYEERFQLSQKRVRCTLDHESLKLVLVRGVKEYVLENLKKLSRGDIYQLPYNDIKSTLKNHSRAARNKGRDSQALVNTSSSNTSIKGENGNMLEEFKNDFFDTFSLQMDTMEIKRKQEEAQRYLFIFYPKCTRRHTINECPLNFIGDCLVYEENHYIDKFPYIPRLKDVYQGAQGWAK